MVSSRNRQKQRTAYSFSVANNPIERVESFSHLGHIITSSLSDKEDIRSRRNCFIGQANYNMVCFFSKLRCSVRSNVKVISDIL